MGLGGRWSLLSDAEYHGGASEAYRSKKDKCQKWVHHLLSRENCHKKAKKYGVRPYYL